MKNDKQPKGLLSRQGKVNKTVARIGIALMFVATLVLMCGVTGTARADSSSPYVGVLTNNVVVYFAIGLPVFFVGFVVYVAGSKKYGIVAMAIGGMFVLLGVSGMIISALGGNGTGTTPPPPPGTYVAKWIGSFHNPYWGTAHDANTEYPDSPFTACGSVSPAGTDVGGDSTKYYTDNTTKSFTLRIDVDDDAANTVAGYIDPDCANIDMHIFLTNPAPAAAGGNQEIPFWGRITASRMSGTQSNGSYADVFYSDLSAGVYLGFGLLADSGSATHTNDHTYKSYSNKIISGQPAPLVGDWISLGTSDGDVDGEWVSIWWVLDLGLSDYTTPPNGSEVTLKVEIGTDPTNTEYRGNLVEFTFHLVIVRD